MRVKATRVCRHMGGHVWRYVQRPNEYGVVERVGRGPCQRCGIPRSRGRGRTVTPDYLFELSWRDRRHERRGTRINRPKGTLKRRQRAQRRLRRGA